MPIHRFGSKEKYRKWNAYRHIHGIKSRATKIIIRGHAHKVVHSVMRKAKRRR